MFNIKPETRVKLAQRLKQEQVSGAIDRYNRAMEVYNEYKNSKPDYASIYLEIAQETKQSYNL